MAGQQRPRNDKQALRFIRQLDRARLAQDLQPDRKGKPLKYLRRGLGGDCGHFVSFKALANKQMVFIQRAGLGGRLEATVDPAVQPGDASSALVCGPGSIAGTAEGVLRPPVRLTQGGRTFEGQGP